MRWEGRRQSKNVEDRRQISAGPVMVGGGLLTLLFMVLLMFLGVAPEQIAKIAAPPAPQRVPQPSQQANDEMKQFVSVVLADNEDVWGRLFPQHFEGRYSPPTLVLFTGQVRSACEIGRAHV